MNRDEALALLELTGTPTEDEVQNAYRVQAKRYHPDCHGDVAEHFKKVLTDRFIALGEARDLLCPERSGGAGPGSTSSSGSNKTGGTGAFSESANEARELAGRRQWTEMMSLLNGMQASYGDRPEYYQLRLDLLTEADQHGPALDAGDTLLSFSPELKEDGDYLHHLSVLGLLAGEVERALIHVRNAQSLFPGSVPAFIETHARLMILKGDTQEADRLIEVLSNCDPNNELVRARAEVWNVQGTYVQKEGAANSACVVCVVLELIFDCI